MGLFSRKQDEVVEPTPVVPGAVVNPEDTVRELEDIPQDDTTTNGDLPHNTNDAPELIAASNDEVNNPVVQGKDHSDKTLQRKEGESQQEYNERIPVAIQPVQPAPTHSYLGEWL
jgi:hypothetical protein